MGGVTSIKYKVLTQLLNMLQTIVRPKKYKIELKKMTMTQGWTRTWPGKWSAMFMAKF